METAKQSSYPKKILCDIFGHKYQISKDVTYHVKEYKCKYCNHEMTVNGNGHLTELTPKFKEINAILTQMYANKLARMKSKRFETNAA